MSRLRYQPELDGVRALSALAVLAFHVGVPFLPNGRVGVSVFFVLSGYLITSLLRDGMGVREFYERRARRLFPAYFAFLGIVYAVTFLAFPGWNSTPSFLWAGLYLTDYIYPYVGMWRALGHTWSLAVEMQFYLLWPLVLRYGRKEWLPALFVAAIAIRFDSFLLTRDWHGSYMTLHGNSVGLILGSLVAVYRDQIRPKAWFAWLGAVVVVLAAMSPRGGAMETLLLLTAAEIGSAAMIVGLWRPGALNRALALPPLVWLGKRSYGFYLWHLPILLAIQPITVWPNPNWAMTLALTFAATLITSAISYRVIEQPFQNLGWRTRAEIGKDTIRGDVVGTAPH